MKISDIKCQKLLSDLLPDMEARVKGLQEGWPGADILTALHRNEAHVRRIKELIKDKTNG